MLQSGGRTKGQEPPVDGPELRSGGHAGPGPPIKVVVGAAVVETTSMSVAATIVVNVVLNCIGSMSSVRRFLFDGERVSCKLKKPMSISCLYSALSAVSHIPECESVWKGWG